MIPGEYVNNPLSGKPKEFANEDGAKHYIRNVLDSTDMLFNIRQNERGFFTVQKRKQDAQGHLI